MIPDKLIDPQNILVMNSYYNNRKLRENCPGLLEYKDIDCLYTGDARYYGRLKEFLNRTFRDSFKEYGYGSYYGPGDFDR